MQELRTANIFFSNSCANNSAGLEKNKHKNLDVIELDDVKVNGVFQSLIRRLNNVRSYGNSVDETPISFA
jgi:hypothetical protein